MGNISVYFLEEWTLNGSFIELIRDKSMNSHSRKIHSKTKFLLFSQIPITILKGWNTQTCANCKIFESLRFYVKSILRIFEVQNSLLAWIFREFEFIDLSLILIIDFIQLLWIIWLRKELFTPFLTSSSVRHSVEKKKISATQILR